MYTEKRKEELSLYLILDRFGLLFVLGRCGSVTVVSRLQAGRSENRSRFSG
jgi:hypothetical protein